MTTGRRHQVPLAYVTALAAVGTYWHGVLAAGDDSCSALPPSVITQEHRTMGHHPAQHTA
jgi:hypothetical protein